MSAQTAVGTRLGSSASSRTVRAMIATALAVLPLAELFTDQRWVLDGWMAIAIVAIPAAILRINGEPRVWHTWVGVALLVPWLTSRFLSDHAIATFIPTTGTWGDLDRAFDAVRATTRDGIAPVHADAAVTFVLALVLGLVAAFVDLIAVVGRRPALAGVPILIVFTVAGAVPRHPVTWIWFVAAASGFLLLLSLDAGDMIRDWGRVIPRAGETRARPALSVSGPRIAVVALTIAVLIPVIVPTRATNLLADFLHARSGSSGSGVGGGFGAGSGISLDPFAGLKGSLQRKSPTPLFTVTLDSAPPHPAFYLRANVLSTYTPRGWIAAAHGDEENINHTGFDSIPPANGTVDNDGFSATIGITGLADNPPVFGRPVAVSGLDDNASWSGQDQLLLGPKTRRGQQILEQISQPSPTTDELNQAGDIAPGQYPEWLQVPKDMSATVIDLVNRLVQADETEYERALALNTYFTDRNNGFVYSLTVPGGDSGSALVDFLTNKQGYCQQYAAALGIMMRLAGIPSRVVLGYTHPTADTRNQFTVTTINAHAWVEAFFPTIGWIPFDPTPRAGIAGGSTADLAWAPHPHSTGNPDDTLPTKQPSTATAKPSGGSTTTAPSASTSHDAQSVGWLVWAGTSGLLVLAVGATPAAARWWRRRARIRAARHGDADALWTELSDTARDLGYVWSASRTPRQVVTWLGPQVSLGRPEDGPLAHLATAVERSRYAPAGTAAATTSLVTDLRAVESSLRGGRSRSTRMRSRLLPASLGWRWGRRVWRRRH